MKISSVYEKGKKMAASHAELQKSVKTLFEAFGWYVIENKKGKSSRYYNSGLNGIADLLAIKPNNNIIWLEIKTPNDIQKPHQKKFQKDVESQRHKYYLIYDIGDAETIIKINKVFRG